MQLDQAKLKQDNQALVTAMREKNRKHQQIQELYDRLKRREMTAVTRHAAFDSVDDVLQSVNRAQPPSDDRFPNLPNRAHQSEDRFHNRQQLLSQFPSVQQQHQRPSHSPTNLDLRNSNGNSLDDAMRMPPPGPVPPRQSHLSSFSIRKCPSTLKSTLSKLTRPSRRRNNDTLPAPNSARGFRRAQQP